MLKEPKKVILKERKNKLSSFIVSGSILIIALVGATWLTPKVIDLIDQNFLFREKTVSDSENNQPSLLLPLLSFSPEERDIALKALASSDKPSLDSYRARYLLAVDLLQQYQGGDALELLDGLEEDYPVLAPQILFKRGRAYELTNENKEAQETWLQLITDYPESPMVAEALYKLGTNNRQYWQQAITQFPGHPRTQEIINQLLSENPNQPQLLLLVAKYNPNDPTTNPIRDRLVKNYSNQLTASDWQIIADGYWDNNKYKEAAKAYSKIASTPENAYRLARSLQVSDQKQAAIEAYGKMIQKYPDAPETALALKRLAGLVPSKQALGYWNQIINKFPKQAPEALLEKAKLLDSLNNKKSAAQTRQLLLDKYPQSDATAKYRWSIAQKLADQGNFLDAWKWAQPISANNPESDLAAKSGFWVGKWAQKLGHQREAKKAFEQVLFHYPQSYYAWRSAVMLGWDVGDFNTIRQLNPLVDKSNIRNLPPAGSDAFKELYLLGQDEDAINLFTAEISQKENLSVNETFTLSLLDLIQGKNLKGINTVFNLKDQDTPQAQQEWQLLRQTPQYWQALFPFPFESTILEWSQKRQLNPLLVTSLIRQESRFEPEIRSFAGATGLMQVMPSTGDWIAPKIGLSDYSLSDVEDNVNMGTWYLDYTHQEYDNNSVLAVASYNAGPGNVAKWAKQYGLKDMDVFIEKIPFAETKGYVESVFGNYWNYLRLYNPEVAEKLSNYLQTKR